MPSLTDVILGAFEDRRGESPLTSSEIVHIAQKQYADAERVPNANEIRGRLSRLASEGIVTRPERGHYELVRTDPQETAALTSLTELLEELLRPDARRRSVVWDATPYLDLAEDGAPGTRVIIEHANATSFRDELLTRWPTDRAIATWSEKQAGPLGTTLWNPTDQFISHDRIGLILVERERFGATGLTDRGVRTPFPERILCEFLGPTGPPDATPIVRSLLRDERLTLERLRQAADTMGVSTPLGALLVAAEDAVPPAMREAYLEDLPPVVRHVLEGRPR